MLGGMNRHRTLKTGRLLLKGGGIAIGLILALLGTLKDLFADTELAKSDRPIQDSDLIGDYNYRMQQFDSGTDPAGWYEDES